MIEGQPITEHYKLVAANAAFVYSKFVENIPLPEAYQRMEQMILEGAMGEVMGNLSNALIPEPLEIF
jgi:hypothetical protein